MITSVRTLVTTAVAHDCVSAGLLVAYCHRFDVWTGSSNRIYYVSCAVGNKVIMQRTIHAYVKSQYANYTIHACNFKVVCVCACTAYTLGLVLTFVVMLLSKMGQPALLYLVPFTLLTSGLLAWKRKEFRQFWAGTTYQVSSSDWTPYWFVIWTV